MERELVSKVIEEMNTQMGLVPVMPVLESEEDNIKLIKTASALIHYKDDYSDEVTKALIDIGGLLEDVATVFEMKLNLVENLENIVKEEAEEKALEEKAELPEDVVAKKGRKRKPHIVRLEELIAEGKHTATQIVKILLSEFSELKKDTVANYIRSAKSKKYTQFSYVAIEDIHGVLRFEENLK